MPGGYAPVAGPFWASANVTPPSNKAAVRPIRADLVMIFSRPICPTEKTTDGRRRFRHFVLIQIRHCPKGAIVRTAGSIGAACAIMEMLTGYLQKAEQFARMAAEERTPG